MRGFVDFNEFLHTLRTLEIQKMPPGAEVLLSAGCNGRSYFDWIFSNYPGIVKHYGIEAYIPMPSDLPGEAVWLPDYLYDMKSVADMDVDLVFAGQTVEHLWPNELAGFLMEAHRVLKPDGRFVLDSPNRFITQAIQWFHPEHTIEYTVYEITELLGLAGFTDVHIKGMWLCYARETKSFLPLIPDLENINIEEDTRIKEAIHRPEDSFVWWIEAKKDPSFTPMIDRLSQLTQSIYNRVFPSTLRREFSHVGVYHQHAITRTVVGESGKPGYLRFGPYVPLRPSRYIAQFHIGFLREGDTIKHFGDELALKIDVTVNMAGRTIAEKNITSSNLKNSSPNGFLLYKQKLINRVKKWVRFFGKDIPQRDLATYHLKSFELPFSIEKVEFGVQFRAYTTGVLPIILESSVQLYECNNKSKKICIS